MVVENATKSRLVQLNTSAWLWTPSSPWRMSMTCCRQASCSMCAIWCWQLFTFFYHVARQKIHRTRGMHARWEAVVAASRGEEKYFQHVKIHGTSTIFTVHIGFFGGPITLATQFPYRRSGGVRKRWTWISKRSSRTWKAADGRMNPKRRWWLTLYMMNMKYEVI